MSRGVFVAGTDTGVGKTRVAAALVYALAQQGWRAVGMKPVASGCPAEAELPCEDVQHLLAAGNVSAPLASINPYRFEPPVAPHLAAAAAGIDISLGHIVACYRNLQSLADWVVVEGVGGLLVPLDGQHDTADMAQQLGVPVVLVVGMRLGCINHALLTATVLQQRGLELAGWVASCVTPDMACLEQNVAALQQRIVAPLLGVVPWSPDATVAESASYLDLNVLSGGEQN